MSTKAQREMHYENVFFKHCWGNKNNSGKNYQRPYSKTSKKKGNA